DNANGINMTAAQFNALDTLLLAEDTINVIDTAAGIQAELSTLVTNVAQIDAINASDNANGINMTAAQFNVLGSKLVAEDNIVIVDDETGIEAQLNNILTHANFANLDTINCSDAGFDMTATQAATVGLGGKITAADVITIAATINGAQTIETGVFTGDDVITLSALAITGATGYSAYSGGGPTEVTGNGATVELVVGAGAQVASFAQAALLFNTTSGELTFDPDGTGVETATTVVTLIGVAALTAGEFTFIV
ncbi:MAG: hypothetical protein HQK72_14380, partial [Desulfamplus sp.]|nr:hypothetical protein [Desulfamplus sp.]